jgi:hypothetical protein
MKSPTLRAASILCLMGLLVVEAPANEPGKQGTWEKLADSPRDVAGRESCPGMDGAWVYVPQWRGFLLYGGCSPTYSNEGWFFDPDTKEWTILWAHDALSYDRAKKQWRALMPRDIVWSLDRPGPARGQAVIAVGKTVYLFGGHPTLNWQGNGRHQRADFLGATKLGTWTLSPATGRFQHLGDEGPAGATRAVYDSANYLIVTAPEGPWAAARKNPIHVFSPATGKWESRPLTGGPPQARYVGWAYDAKARKCVYFAEHGETWTYDAARNEWKNMKPAQAPRPRRHAAMAYDAAAGLTVLHGGVTYPDKKDAPHAFDLHRKAIAFDDTWVYDAARNEWRELRPATSPPKIHSARDLLAYDPDRKMLVLYDVAIGVWAYRGEAGGAMPAAKPRPVPLPLLTARKPPGPYVRDARVRGWQEKIKSLADDSWLDSGVQVPTLGCQGITYDSKNRCIPQLGGCGGAVFSTPDDYGYHNQLWVFDMEVGKFYLRRPHHNSRPHGEGIGDLRAAAGCTRGFCFDTHRGVIWAQAGMNYGWRGGMTIRSYDVARDTFGKGGPDPGTPIGQCDQLVYDAKHDVVVYADTWNARKTFLYDPRTNKWSDGGPCPEFDKPGGNLQVYINRVYDPEVGVIMILPRGKAMKTFAYDVATRKWRDLNPKGSAEVPYCTIPGIVYDSRNRAVILIKSDHNSSDALTGQVRILDLATNTWKEGTPLPARLCLNMGSAAYDANHNLVLCTTGSGGKLWFYRYKGGCPADAFLAK